MAPGSRECGPQQYAAWDAYVNTISQGTVFHRSGWRDVIKTAFRHQPHYIFAEQDGVITGVLPLVHVRSVLFGNRLVSVPFCVYGGPLANDMASAQALTNHAIDLINQLGADVVEVRAREPHALQGGTR